MANITASNPGNARTTPQEQPDALQEAWNRRIGGFKLALHDEIKEVRSSGGQKSYITDGRYLGQREGRSIYSFSADSELRFPDDTSCDIEFKRKKYGAVLLSVVGFDLLLALDEHIGETVPNATLYTAPWFLLEELSKRLQEMRTETADELRVAYQLLTLTDSVAKPPQLDIATKLLAHIGRVQGMPVEHNQYQLQAVGQVLANRVSFIWGPPGTGKSRTLGLTAAALAVAGKSVLILAHSNVAVDVAMLNAARYLDKSQAYGAGHILRYGLHYLDALDAYPQLHVRGVLHRQNPALIREIERLESKRRELMRQTRAENGSQLTRTRLKNALEEIKATLAGCYDQLKAQEIELVQGAQLVGCTLSKATIAAPIFSRRFNTVLIDEASMAYIPHCLFSAALAEERVAIYGDFRQLAPISQASTGTARRWLQRDIFDDAGITRRIENGQNDERLVTLRTQYRMHPHISAVPNELFYGQRLIDGPHVQTQVAPTAAAAPEPGKPLVYYDLSRLDPYSFHEKESYSRFNLVSALLSASLACQIARQNHTVGIVTPYNAQSRLIHRLLKDSQVDSDKVTVATVHRFQGSERDVIIFDTVEGDPLKPGRLVTDEEGDSAMRLSNVAVSRAKGKFILLANPPYIKSRFKSGNSFRRLAERIERDAPPQTPSWRALADGQGLPDAQFFHYSEDAKAAIEADIANAGEEIAIAWPLSVRQYHFSLQSLKNVDNGRVRFSVMGAGSKEFHIGLSNAQIWDWKRRIPYGLVGIDRKVLWLYTNPQSAGGAVLRLPWPQTVKLLYGFWRLVPDEDVKHETMEALVEQGKSPLGGQSCPQCDQPLWLERGRYGVYMACTAGCGHTRKITDSDATNLARLMGIVCGKCGGQVRGRRSSSGAFLGCANYPDCRWTKDLRDLV